MNDLVIRDNPHCSQDTMGSAVPPSPGLRGSWPHKSNVWPTSGLSTIYIIKMHKAYLGCLQWPMLEARLSELKFKRADTPSVI